MSRKNIYVTQPFLPPLEEFVPLLAEIWENKILTNGGPFHRQLEQELADYLGVKHVCLFSNATLALIVALQALRVTGEVITTPYSFVATAHSLLWHGNKPIFVDVDPSTLNLDPDKIAAAITANTTAIMPVHCYGQPCRANEIKEIADKYNLKVIYDAAHAFAVKDHSGSILQYGDLAVLSFHATKVFNTFEGGAIICHDENMKRRIDHLKNFGFTDELTVVAPGLNGKMSELNAAFGLVQLRHIEKAIAARRQIDTVYRSALENVSGIDCLPLPATFSSNYSYFPILVSDKFPLARDDLYLYLKEQGIHTRRYFYPLISQFPMYKSLPSAAQSNLPVASMAAEKILCLPIYPELKLEDARFIVELISKFK